jgi:cyclophilin family peptidyl-prolyl cis-trans isomerase/protein-disulfide isomerase
LISCARPFGSSSIALPVRAAAYIVGLALLSGCGASTAQPAVAPTVAAVPSTAPAAGASPGCRVIEAAPTPVAPSLLDAAAPDEPSLGPVDAAVTLLFYCDLQSPQCEVFNRALDALLQGHGRDLRVVFRLYPVPEAAVPALDKSVLSAQATIAAGNQDNYWEMRDLLHSRYDEWIPLSKNDFRAWVLGEAVGIGLDPVRFAADLESRETAASAERAYEAAVSLGISSIPTVFINGRLQERAALSYNGLDSTIGLIALGRRQYRTCPPFVIDPARQYTATLRTQKGDIVIALDAARAPLAVNSFVFLAQEGWYNGSSFHRVIPGFVAQAGDPSGTGSGGPGYYFQNEVAEAARFDLPGVVGMLNSGPDTNGSQFFITYAPQPQLDGSYTVFGRVVQGMRVVESLTPRDPQTTTNPPPGDTILEVMVQVQ